MRAEGDTGGPEYIVKATVEKKGRHGVTLSGVTKNGKTLPVLVEIVGAQVVRVLCGEAKAKKVNLRQEAQRAQSVGESQQDAGDTDF